jgi:hypothetical protein
MRSVPLAMTWEMLNRGRWTLIAGVLGANAFPVVLLTALRYDGPLMVAEPHMMLMHLILVQINMLAFGAAVLTAQGSPSRLYAWPVSTSTIVTWHLLPAMVFTTLELILSTVVLNAIFDLSWPLWGPALFVGVTMGAIQASLWWTEKSAWLPWAMGIVGGLLGIWFKSRMGAPFSQPKHYWLVLTPAEVATMLAITLVAFGIAIAAVSRNRRGEPPRSLGIIAWLERLFEASEFRGLRFRNPAQAQFWFEWRKKGWAMPFAAVAGLLMGAIAWLMFNREIDQLYIGCLGAGGMLSVAGFIGGLVMGNCGRDDAEFELSPFLATRPLATPDLARTILKVAACSVFSTWIIWATTFAALFLLLWGLAALPNPLIPAEFSWWYFPMTLLGPWIITGVGASIGLTGRSHLMVKLLVVVSVSFPVIMLLAKYGLSEQGRVQLAHGLAVVAGIAFFVATASVFVMARRHVLIGWPTVYVAASLWVALTVAMVVGFVLHPVASVAAGVLMFGILSLAVAPLAAAPLALAWNRHR